MTNDLTCSLYLNKQSTLVILSRDAIFINIIHALILNMYITIPIQIHVKYGKLTIIA